MSKVKPTRKGANKPGQGPKSRRDQALRRPRSRLWLLGLSVVGLALLAVVWAWQQRTPPLAQKQSTTEIKIAPTNSTDANLDKLAAERKQESTAALWNTRANDLLKSGQTKEAIEAYKQAIALGPKDEDLHFNLGIAYAKSGELTNAENEYLEALRLLPDYPEVHNNLGNVLMRQGRVAEAEQHFQEALKLMPEYAQAHNNLGILRQQQKQTQEALLCFQKAVEFDTNYWEAHFNLAGTYLRLDQKDKAIAELRETLRLNPSFDVAQRILARTLGQTNSPSSPNPPAP